MVFPIRTVIIHYLAHVVDELHCFVEDVVVPRMFLPPLYYQGRQLGSCNQMGLLWLVDDSQSKRNQEILSRHMYIAECEHLDDEPEEEPGLKERLNFCWWTRFVFFTLNDSSKEVLTLFGLSPYLFVRPSSYFWEFKEIPTVFLVMEFLLTLVRHLDPWFRTFR